MTLRTCVIIFFVTPVVAVVEEWLEVKTEQGLVRGRKHPSEDLYTFYNIPYATAPTGVNKFKAPLPPPTWSEPLESVEMNFVCPQNIKIIQEFLPGKPVMHENCLVANIFIPKSFEADLSVLVYVHGGGFSLGYGNRNKGIQLMKKKDFIMVTFNYRLGVHGFLCLGTEDIPGNAGLKDQVALLRWVQSNIANFGGNPGDVTLAGGSSGAASVDLIMLSKLAEGLFHRVIPESAGNLAAFAIQRDPLQIAKYYAAKLNFTKVHDVFALEDFYKTSPLKLLTSVSLLDRTDSTFLFSPCVESNTRDGAFLTQSPLSILKAGDYKKLPMLYGFTSMEGMLRIDYFNIWRQRMFEQFSDFLPADLKFQSEKERENVAIHIKNEYFGDKQIDNSNILGFIDYFSHVMVTYPMLRAVKLHVEAGNKQVYLYEYNYLGNDIVPYVNIEGVDHCAQSKAWLDDVEGENGSTNNRHYQNVRKTIRQIWHDFITTGNPVPKHSSLPEWPAVGKDWSPHMSLGKSLELRREVLLKQSTRFWDDIYQKYYRDAIPPPELPASRLSSGYLRNKRPPLFPQLFSGFIPYLN